MAKKKTDNLEQQAEREGYSLEREHAETIVLWPKDGTTATRFETEAQVREHLRMSG